MEQLIMLIERLEAQKLQISSPLASGNGLLPQDLGKLLMQSMEEAHKLEQIQINQ